MNSFRSEPFLWIHLAGLAVVPLSLLVVWLGLAAGDPVLPVVLEIGFLAIAGIVPIAWMQWQRPFDIFSLLVLAVRPDRLTEEQRKILRLLKTLKIRIAAIAVAVFMVGAIWQIYRVAPLAAIATPFSPRWHLLGLFIAAIAFFSSNLFLQIPVSALGVLLTSDSHFAEIEPYEVENIGRDFFIFGMRIQNFFAIASASTSTPPTAKTQPVNPTAEKDSSPEQTVPEQTVPEQTVPEQTFTEFLENEEKIQDDNVAIVESITSPTLDDNVAIVEPITSPTLEEEKTETENPLSEDRENTLTETDKE